VQKQWKMPPQLTENTAQALSAYSPIERQILAARGVQSSSEAEDFLARRYALPDDPFRLTGMQEAVALLLDAVHRKRTILIYGDYDTDGVTAIALLREFLQGLGGQVKHYIPHRLRQGYGMHGEAVQELSSEGSCLLVTVDCGIRALAPVQMARELGMDVIITDHHAPGAQLPNADVVLNPKQPDDAYPFKELAGVGIAYKLAQGISRHSGRADPEELLDLVALGTVADVCPLLGENRALVWKGLTAIRDLRRPGLRALIEVAGLQLGSIGSYAIAFMLAPRLNAAGRLESAEQALELLVTQHSDEAQDLARGLNKLNQERQKLTQEATDRARAMVEEKGEPPAFLVLADPDFHDGITGLVAARLVEEFNRPTAVGSLAEGKARLSARSVPGFSMIDALHACAEDLHRYGGHESAAGFTVLEEKLEDVRAQLQEMGRREMQKGGWRSEINIDAVVRFPQLTAALLEFLDRIEPCGHSNPRPIFLCQGIRVLEKRRVGSAGKHLKLTLENERRIFDAIAFRRGAQMDELPDLVDAVFHFERNLYMGVETSQLHILDIRPAAEREY
jgi:single-stranded-DNA-specific exonuclease